jgi:hypothetical protein
MNQGRRLTSYAERVFGLDVRSLALLRIALGLLVLGDLAVRASDFAAMYSAEGFAPAGFVHSLAADGQWSLFFLNEASWHQAALMVAAASCAAALGFGYRTRLATIASWALLISLQARLPVVVNAGDTLLRQLLFWGMFLPLGSAWSVDSRRRPPAAANPFVSIASAALVIQLALVYWGAGLAKWNDAWTGGDALHSIFAYSLYSLPLGHWLQGYPEVTRWLTRSVVWLELLGPLLSFSPWATGRLRLAALAIFIPFHLGIAATVTVGLFSYVAMAAWLALIPSACYGGLSQSSTDARGTSIGRHRGSWVGAVTAVVCSTALLVVLAWNAIVIGPKEWRQAVGPRLAAAVRSVGLHQTWGVFRRPTPWDSWFVYEARLVDGRVVDLLTGKPARDYSRPIVASGNFPNHRWRKLHAQLRTRRLEPYRQGLADYMVRRWNAAHLPEEQVAELRLYCYSQRVDSTEADGDYVRQELAYVGGADGGAFAEAARELEL